MPEGQSISPQSPDPKASHKEKIEAEYTPDTSNGDRLNKAVETYILFLKHILGIDLSDPRIDDLKLLSYGCGSGADVIALHQMNPNIIILGAVDTNKDKQQIIDPQTGRPIFTGITHRYIGEFIHDPSTQETRNQANIITGMRLGPETLKSILKSLEEKQEFLGIFSVGSLGVHFDGIQSLMEEAFGKGWEERFAIKMAGEGDMEDIFVITPKNKDNQFYRNYFLTSSPPQSDHPMDSMD